MQRDGVCVKVSAGESHWQFGRVESHGKILKSMLTRMDAQHPITSDADFRQCLRAAVQAKHSLSRVRGFTPEQAVFGKLSRLPASLVSDEQASSHALAASNLPEGLAFRQSLQRRKQARVAFTQADNDNSYRRALLRKSRSSLQTYEAGDWVLYWRRHRVGHRTRGERGRWYGPAQVIVGDRKVVWLSHCRQLIRASPEHLRSASMREWQVVRQQQQNGADQISRAGIARGVVDLVGVGELPSRDDVEIEGDVPVGAPELIPPEADVVANNNAGLDEDGPQTTEPVPSEPRPVEASAEQPEMEVSPAVSMEQEAGNLYEPDFVHVPIPEDDDDDLLFGDTECFLIHPSQDQVWEINLHETDVDFKDLPSPDQALHYVLLATPERKKRVEVRLRGLSGEERQQFEAAKQKEVGAWMDHRTVRRVAAGTLDDSQLMRRCWVLTWKPPEKEGGARRPKARLVVLGFEDPDIGSVPNDAPTLGKDARQILLQQVGLEAH